MKIKSTTTALTDHTTISIRRDDIGLGTELAILLRKEETGFTSKFAIRQNHGKWFKGFDTLTECLDWGNTDPTTIPETVRYLTDEVLKLRNQADSLTAKIALYDQLQTDLNSPTEAPPF